MRGDETLAERVEALRRIPDFLQVAFVITVACAAVIWATVTIILVVHWTAGPPSPPPTCGGSGVLRVIPETDHLDGRVVCNNGSSYSFST